MWKIRPFLLAKQRTKKISIRSGAPQGESLLPYNDSTAQKEGHFLPGKSSASERLS